VGELLEFVSANMPNGNPHSLSEDTYADIVAVMLQSNGFPSGKSELGTDTAGVKIVPRDGSAKLPANALVRVIGCLNRSGQDWVVTKGTAPERAEHAAQAEQEAAMTLGTRTIALKFVLTKLDAFAGARISVTGLLMGADGVDGINVTTVKRVAASCN
jgi:hypothetical protein